MLGGSRQVADLVGEPGHGISGTDNLDRSRKKADIIEIEASLLLMLVDWLMAQILVTDFVFGRREEKRTDMMPGLFVLELRSTSFVNEKCWVSVGES
jgi:hypothetical protein